MVNNLGRNKKIIALYDSDICEEVLRAGSNSSILWEYWVEHHLPLETGSENSSLFLESDSCRAQMREVLEGL